MNGTIEDTTATAGQGGNAVSVSGRGNRAMTPRPSRRALLAGTAAAATLAAVASPSLAAGNPDADLIALCAEHIANFHAFNASPLDSDDDPLWPAYERTREAIEIAKPQTLAGILAKARVAKAEASMLAGPENPHGSPAADWAWDLVNDLLRVVQA